MEDSNILVTFHPNEKEHAKTEIIDLLKEIDHPAQSIWPTEVEGVYAVRIFNNAKVAIAKLRTLCQASPGRFRHTFHWVPIDHWVPSKLEPMKETARALGRDIGRTDRWKMHLHKRHFPDHGEELVRALTDPIERGVVDLRHPQKVIVVEIIGGMAGMSLASTNEILDVHGIIGRIEMEIELER